jgi:hypothetical protein
MSKHIQTILSDEEHKRVRIKSIELGKDMREFAKEALLEKCEKPMETEERKEDEKGE